jgi:hypothetical protein
MTKKLEEYLAHWDPIELVSQGAPSDEYALEAQEIHSRFEPKMSDDELGSMIQQVFVDLMEVNPAGFLADCIRRAPVIRQLLLQSV